MFLLKFQRLFERLIISDQKSKKQQSEAMDPINALQNLTNQGTRNPMPTQMTQMMGNQMGMGNANVNPNVLQNLINVSPIRFIFFLNIVDYHSFDDFSILH